MGVMKNRLEVLYEDNHVIVVKKEANILSQADDTKDIDLLTMVKEYIREKYHKPGNVYVGLVHRLDRPVSGVMVFAKTSKAASRLSAQIQKHQMEKRYMAVVHGKVGEGTYRDYLKRVENGNTIVVSKEEGKEAILDYRCLEYSKEKDCSLVEIDLKTGRHHQIRVQFAHHAHPLCGDQRYGTLDRTQIALHACYLSFYHPTTKEKMEFFLPPPTTGYWAYFTVSKNVK